MPATAAAQLGLQLAGQAAGAGMGMILGGINDRRQIRQQEKLQAMQIKGQKEMGDYNYKRQKQMWEETNYPAQMEQLKKAGLNPGLIYGMGGGGGATTGSQGGNIGAGSAPQGGGEIATMAGMGLQSAMNLKLMQAQKENIEADTANKQADTTKKSGIETEEGKARIDMLMQGVDNARQQHEIQKLEITMKNIENFEKQGSQEDRMDYIEYQTKIAARQLQLITNDAKLSTATIEDKIKIIAQDAIGAALRNELTKSQTAKTQSDIKLNNETLNQWIQNNMREWDKMTQENRKIRVMELMQDFNTDPVNRATDQISRIVDNIFLLTPKLTQPGRTVVEGFKPRY